MSVEAKVRQLETREKKRGARLERERAHFQDRLRALRREDKMNFFQFCLKELAAREMLPAEEPDLFELNGNDPRVISWLSKLRTMMQMDQHRNDDVHERVVRELWQGWHSHR
jgi:hypothetical protein